MDEVNEISGSVTIEPKKYHKKVIVSPVIEVETPLVVEDINPVIEPIIEAPVKSIKYKMNLYTSNGLLRAQISRGIFGDMSRRHGDIMRAVSSGQWVTIEEIITVYNSLVKRLRFNVIKSPDQIEAAVKEMAEAGLILMK
jgi:hypothetical protein